jgi:hypothetical protein
MSITYEEALSTLESMFGAPWDRHVLDLILRHFQGHMENTVEAILAHGDQAPALLVQTLNDSTKTNNATTADAAAVGNQSNREAQDSMLARQLAAEEEQRHQQMGAAAAAAAQQQQQTTPSGRGLPTELPADFLRIPGFTTTSTTSTTSTIMDQDEALARMLQDELFSQELANNPEFAHLVNGGAGGGRHRNQRTTAVPQGSQMQYPSRSRMAAGAGNNSNPAVGPPIMDHIAGTFVGLMEGDFFISSFSSWNLIWVPSKQKRTQTHFSFLSSMFCYYLFIFSLLPISYSPLILRPPSLKWISELGQDAKKRLQLFAAQWNNGVNQIASRLSGNANSGSGGGIPNATGSTSGGIPQNRAAANETRGLLDGHDDDDEGEEMEMSFTPTNTTTTTKPKHQ